jgi:DNA polymerase-3 subunit delta'
MLTLKEIQGQAYLIHHLRQAVATGQVHHAYLFYGPDGVGKRTTAIALAAALNCPAPQQGDACGQCSSCLSTAGGNHPDFYQVDPQGKNIKIDQIRQLQEGLSYKHWQGNYKVALISDADLMTEEAANSLLKILEEPGERTCFVLTTTRPQSLLPTILSRCQKYSFRPLGPEEIQRVLEQQGVDASQADMFARLSNGSLGRALAMVADDTFLEQRQKAHRLCERLMTGGITDCFEIADELNQEEPGRLLELMANWWRDVLVWQLSGTETLLVNVDLIERIKKESIPAESLKSALWQLEQARQWLGYNANRRLCLEVMALQINQHFSGRKGGNGW